MVGTKETLPNRINQDRHHLEARRTLEQVRRGRLRTASKKPVQTRAALDKLQLGVDNRGLLTVAVRTYHETSPQND